MECIVKRGGPVLSDRLRRLSPAKRDLLMNRMSTAEMPVCTDQSSPSGDAEPLLPAQRRIWFLEQLAPGETAYNLAFSLRITGKLDIGALQASVRQLVRRHDALRTR